MFEWILKKIVGTKHERELKRIRPMVVAINELEPKYKDLTDEQLRRKTAEFREKLDQGQKLDDLLIPAFAVCREAGRRALGMRHYDVQLIGGIVLHEGKIAEMKTGEGKTLVATLACYLNALEGKGVHVVTVNDYLAKRDSEWMGRLYGFLGLSTGVVVHSQGNGDKKRAYRCDITYGQNNEFGFDYLRDNMKFSIYDYAQKDLNFAIVDEVDSILVDEARTPLIISGPGETASQDYMRITEIIPRLRKDEHYTLDEKNRQVALTEDGIEKAQSMLRDKGVIKIENLFDPVNLDALHILNQSLRAHTLYKRDEHYMVTPDGKILIIDEFTGRALPGRRWSDGLHQSVEAKEHVPIQDENRTLATISFQNLFRLYKKLGGMTGTADTEAEEFHKIYKLEVDVIPTNRQIQRKDYEDLVYKTEREKFKAVCDEIIDCHKRGQPVLVGTTSVEKSDALARMLHKAAIPHNVLNAKQHEREAYVVAQAGRKGAVTVATNMAGRGTDILLGGNPEMLARMHVLQNPPLVPNPQSDGAPIPDIQAIETAVQSEIPRFKQACEAEKKEVLEAGGLHILGTERHESRRIDNQLRGRSGRQGDPGSSRFYLSLEDDLMRIFAGERIQSLMERLGMEEGVPIEHPMVSRSVENAQKKVEERNFDIRKNLLDYDDVMNQQRKSIYALRRQVLEGQYRTVPTEDEAKKGIQSESLIEKIDEGLRETARPLLTELVKFAGAKTQPPPQGAPVEEVQAWRENALKASMSELGPLHWEPMEFELYRLFGCRLDIRKHAAHPAECLSFLIEEVARSLTEQRERLYDLVDEIVGTMVDSSCPSNKHFENWDIPGLTAAYDEQFGIKATGLSFINDATAMAEKLYSDAESILRKKEKDIGPILFLRFFRQFYLEEVDKQWIDHLQSMDHLRDGIHLRGYGQRDPKKEYKKEGFDLFLQMIESLKSSVTNKMFRFEVVREDDIDRFEAQRRRQIEQQQRRTQGIHASANPEPEQPVATGRPSRPQPGRPSMPEAAVSASAPKSAPVRREKPKTSPNDPCWCNSGKKYKRCHMRADETGSDSPETS